MHIAKYRQTLLKGRIGPVADTSDISDHATALRG
jgi:hypothetical protein